MKAPSEKHLEDWIVYKSNGELRPKDGEDIIPLEKIIGRQFRLPSGIADLLVYGNVFGVSVLELKRDVIDEKSLAQCLKYMRDLKFISDYALAAIRDASDIGLTFADPKTHGILIGYGVKNEHILTAATVAGIDVIDYDYDAEVDTYHFRQLFHQVPDWRIYYDYSLGVIGDHFRLGFEQKADWIADSPEQFEMFEMLIRTMPAFRMMQASDIPTPYYMKPSNGSDGQ